MYGKFKVIVPSFNTPHYLQKCLTSIETQTCKNFDVCVIDDASTLSEHRKIVQEFTQRKGWKAIYHDQNLGALAGIVEAIKLLECQDDDVIVMLDGDDWFYDASALETVAKAYNEEELYLTWGSFITFPPNCIHMTYAAPVTDKVVKEKLYREILDVFGHLKTFKYRIYREVNDEDLRDPENHEYFRVSWDKALLYPMLEMCGPKFRFIPEILHVYNIDSPLNDFKINRPEQESTTLYIRNLPKYPSLALP